MITESFDPISREIVRSEDTLRPAEKELARGVPIDTFLLTFSGQLIRALLENSVIEPIDSDLTIGSAAFKNPIYRIKGTSFGVVLSGIGAPMIAAILEELTTLFHARHYILFGSCGALTALPEGHLILPTHACRDEGTSYHYAPPEDYIVIRNASKLARIFDALGIEYVQGKTWTTDAFYRETERNRDRRIAEGCLCVEMECSAAQAVCDFRGLELYAFVYAADFGQYGTGCENEILLCRMGNRKTHPPKRNERGCRRLTVQSGGTLKTGYWKELLFPSAHPQRTERLRDR